MKAMGMESDQEVVQMVGRDPRYGDLLFPSVQVLLLDDKIDTIPMTVYLDLEFVLSSNILLHCFSMLFFTVHCICYIFGYLNVFCFLRNVPQREYIHNSKPCSTWMRR